MSALSAIEDVKNLCISMSESSPNNEEMRLRAISVTEAFNTAFKMDEAVLTEICNFFNALSTHNKQAAQALPSVRLTSNLTDYTMVSFCDAIKKHATAKEVNHEWMPWQYRK